VVIYEFPSTERIRALLRLEALFDKVIHFTQSEGVCEHHMAMAGLFEILDVVGRSDPKVELLQELERQRQGLLGFRGKPKVCEDTLQGSLDEIEDASAALHALYGRFGQVLRDSEWLMGLKHKSAIPGWVCGFDVPAYRHWQSLPAAQRRANLLEWQKSILPARAAIVLILRLLRANGTTETLVAEHGQYQKTLNGHDFQLLRITLPGQKDFVPEVSANRYVLNIRFLTPPKNEGRCGSSGITSDVIFDLGFHSLM
jgi:cell division protein ZapD